MLAFDKADENASPSMILCCVLNGMPPGWLESGGGRGLSWVSVLGAVYAGS
jgi:hypothetical protein